MESDFFKSPLYVEDPAEAMTTGRERVRAALVSAEGLAAAQVGENSFLTRALDFPTGIVAADPVRARQELAFRRIAESEEFARWAAKKRENAALARDDIEGLAGVFDAVANFGNRLMHWAVFESAGDVKNIGRQLTHGMADLNRSMVGKVQGVTDNVFGPDSAPSRYLEGVQEWIKWARPEEVRADSFLGQLGYDFVRSAPQMAMQIPAALANPALGLSLMGVQIAGGSYANLRDEGVSPLRALVSSLTNAAAQAPLERLGLDRFMSIFRSSSFRDTLGRTLGSMGTEMVTEYLQQWPDSVTELWALAEKESDDVTEQVQWFGSRLSDVETLARINREGAYAGLIGMLWGGLGGGARSLAVRNFERQRAADFAQRNVELHNAVEATQTKRLAPDHMADALASASDVLAQSVYIPAQAALDLAAQGQDILTPLGISAEQARQALESGADLEVSLATLHARLDSAGMESVAQIMRQTADAPNALEAEQVDSAAQAQAVVEDARRRLRQNDAVRQEEARLVSEMLPLMGNRDVAEQYAKLFRAQATAFETAYGVDAAESLRRVRVERGEELAQRREEALHQSVLYEQTPMGESARASLERDIRNFGAAVDAIAAAKVPPSSPVKMLEQTPLVMRLLGRDTVTGKAAAQGGVYAAPHVFDGTHPNMTPEMWKQIPGALADPVAVFDSDSPTGRARGDLVFMLELTDASGATVVVPVALDAAKGRNQAHVNIVKSAYAKESGGVPANKWFLRQLKKNARYVNGQKMKPWLRAAGADSPLGSWKDLAAANASRNKVYTEADLVNLRQRNPALYQPANVNSPAPFAASPDTFLSEDGGAARTLAQDETDAAPESGRAYPYNGREVGVITEEIAATLALDKPGPIVLDDTGRRHVEERHGEEIRSLGFADAQEFISFVLSHVDAVYAVNGNSRKYDIVSRAMTPQGRVMVRLEFDAAGDYYSIATAGPVRPQYYHKKSPLWERAQSSHSASGTPDAISGQSGELRQDAATEINLTSGAAKGKRASVTFQPDGSAIIRIFGESEGGREPFFRKEKVPFPPQ